MYSLQLRDKCFASDWWNVGNFLWALDYSINNTDHQDKTEILLLTGCVFLVI